MQARAIIAIAAAVILSACGLAGVTEFSGKRGDYTIAKTTSGYTVTDAVGVGGTTTVDTASVLKFSDALVSLDIYDKSKTISAADLKSLIEFYIAYFNRVPDAVNLAYWIDQRKGGQSLDQIADLFYASAIQSSASTGYTSGMSDAEFVRNFFKNVLGSAGAANPPDSALSTWTAMLATGGKTRAGLIKTMLSDIRTTYANHATLAWIPALLDNKVAVGNYFAVELGLAYITSEETLSKTTAIAAAVSATDTANAIALIGVTESVRVVNSSIASNVAGWLRAAPAAEGDATHFAVIGIQNFNGIGPTAEDVISKQGPAAFYQNAQAVQAANDWIANRLASQGPVMRSGGITSFRDVANLPWGMVEPAQGQYNFTLMDQLARSYQIYNIDYVGVAMPFASWDLATRPAAADICKHFFTEDYKYLAAAGKMDRYVNLDAFATMLQTTAERYDGDGVSDMPGLTRSIKYWQIQNEPEGDVCGQFRNDVPAFVELMRRSHNAIKAACPTCKVMNGGAGLVNKSYAGGTFWWDYAAQGGKSYIDIVALHFNDGKSPGVQDVSVFETTIANIKDALGGDKAIWITEFGVMVDIPPGGFVSYTETQAASWYTRFYTAGLNAGVKRFFSDAQSFFQVVGNNSATRRLPYYTNKLLQNKLGGFTASTKLAAGQYRFTVNGAPVYVLWSGVPTELSGTVKSYDIYGVETTGNASALKPTQELPLIVVPVK